MMMLDNAVSCVRRDLQPVLKHSPALAQNACIILNNVLGSGEAVVEYLVILWQAFPRIGTEEKGCHW